MRCRNLSLTTFAVFAALAAPVVSSHHSTNGIYNEEELVEIVGTVREWRFVNPHPSLVLEVQADDGSVQAWDISYGGSAVTHLRRRGYSEDSFAPGDRIVVRGFAARLADNFGLLVRGDPTTPSGEPIVD